MYCANGDLEDSFCQEGRRESFVWRGKVWLGLSNRQLEEVIVGRYEGFIRGVWRYRSHSRRRVLIVGWMLSCNSFVRFLICVVRTVRRRMGTCACFEPPRGVRRIRNAIVYGPGSRQAGIPTKVPSVTLPLRAKLS